MQEIRIPPREFVHRIEALQAVMEADRLDALMVYGDEYRKENLRYVSNFWPIFERAVCMIPAQGDPVLVGAPEGERYAKEMSVWQDLRIVREFACVSVPEEIEFPLATFTGLADIMKDCLRDGRRLGVAGLWDIPGRLMDRFREAAGPDVEIVDADRLLTDGRLIKSDTEVECLKEAGRLCCAGYRALIDASVPGATELEAAGAAEGAARQAGAEAICFMVMGTGERTSTVIGRPVRRVIRDGDMVMASLAVQHEGYVATAEFPFVAGRASAEQQAFLEILLEAARVQRSYPKDGVIGGEMVKAVRDTFRRHKVDRYDVYPPLHGIGLAEAESPYPDEDAAYPLRSGMCVNSDISLFGHPAGSNRIEEGFVIRDEGAESITPLIRELCG